MNDFFDIRKKYLNSLLVLKATDWYAAFSIWRRHTWQLPERPIGHFVLPDQRQGFLVESCWFVRLVDVF